MCSVEVWEKRTRETVSKNGSHASFSILGESILAFCESIALPCATFVPAGTATGQGLLRFLFPKFVSTLLCPSLALPEDTATNLRVFFVCFPGLRQEEFSTISCTEVCADFLEPEQTVRDIPSCESTGGTMRTKAKMRVHGAFRNYFYSTK